ncbi:uncharacterized protein LOC122008585 [Zingiber officinale]|uniref:uncharacterized protein LOC122008585 n=1 Tax=Zingiber officinale TaxID=94328 RepID=UPI001C4BA198|nr:uncharacterized protein LOC122008585 [Zingiber officinale]
MADPDPSNRRCRLCSGHLSKEMETSRWTVAPLIRDSFSMIGTAACGTASAFYGFNYAMPIVRGLVTGPMWLHFFIGVDAVRREFQSLVPTARSTCNCFLIGLCWIGRWGITGSCSTGLLIIPCSCVIFNIITFLRA